MTKGNTKSPARGTQKSNSKGKASGQPPVQKTASPSSKSPDPKAPDDGWKIVSYGHHSQQNSDPVYSGPFGLSASIHAPDTTTASTSAFDAPPTEIVQIGMDPSELDPDNLARVAEHMDQADDAMDTL